MEKTEEEIKMAFEISNLLFLLFFLSVFKTEDVVGAREIRTHQEHGEDLGSNNFKDNQVIEMVHDHSSDDGLAFTVDALYRGKIMTIDFPKKIPPSSLSPFWPKEIADKIPFSSKQLHNLIPYFSYSPNSQQAKAMASTLKACESEPMKGETKFCATSLESLIDLVHDILGSDTPISVLTTKHITPSLVTKQKYTVLETPKEITTPKRIGCHMVPYPYAVYYCHGQSGNDKTLRVSLLGENGDKVEAIAVCHMNTSSFDPNILLRLLNTKPGTPLCHFFAYTNLIWVPSESLNN